MILTVLSAPLQIAALPLIRVIRPWILIRIGWINSTRIGHMAGNMEMRLCAIDAGICKPSGRYLDIWCCTQEYVCNKQLLKMWKRRVIILPRWSVTLLAHLNLRIPGGRIHHIDQYSDRDIHNLLDSTKPHLAFTKKESEKGRRRLTEMGVPAGAKFVCLIIRDPAYLDFFYEKNDWRYHSYRDSDIQNYILAAEALADRGYFVIRMGVKVRAAMKSAHPGIIDYAASGMRSDFMDIYLGANCDFCISTSTGFDAVPVIFRRPVVYVNMMPPGYLCTFYKRFLAITKHHFSTRINRELTLQEIFAQGVGFSLRTSDYASRGIELIENTPEEIRDVVIEMAERLNGTWRPHEDDETLQREFWKIFPTDAVNDRGVPIHGEIRIRYGAGFLRQNRRWLKRTDSSVSLAGIGGL